MSQMRPRPCAPDLPRGVVVRLPAGSWRYGEGELLICVERVRHDLSRYYDDRVWLEGIRLADNGTPVDRVQVLVDTATLIDVSVDRSA